MSATTKLKPRERDLLDKVRGLAPDKLTEVVDFVDFLHERQDDRRLVRDFARLSTPSLRRVWNNPDDAVYDRV